jgi:glyoxylase-like metal-dependent hydrolase (beta-lactamase superfamily II)
MQQIWLTPHGFLKGAIANHATVKSVPNGTEVSFTLGCGAGVKACVASTFTGLINAKNQVERVQTWIDNPVLGDMLVDATYNDYETAGALSFPMHIVQKQGGHPSLELWVSNVQSNAAVDITVPAAVRGAAPPPVRVEAQKIAEGVYYLTGGTHHSVAIDMGDNIVLVEAPLDEARSLAVIAKVKDTVPGKPIGVIVNTHPHFDHAGGLRTLVDEGATIVTHQMNRPYYETAWAAPRTLHPDRLARSGKRATFQTFTDKEVLKGTKRTIEVHRIANSPHHDGFAMVYLPADKILIEADAYTPAAAAPPPAPASSPVATAAAAAPPPPQPLNPTAVNLYENIRRLKLDVERIAALHGPRLATMDDLARAIGRQE